MKDLIFVVKNDGTYEQVPNRNLRAQENYSDNFVVISNQVGVVKAKIRLLSRTDKVEVKYLVPSLESVEDLIGDKVYFQEYANANVWRGAVPKKLLQEISMSYAGQVEISFSFTKPVLDKRAVNKLGDLYGGDLPLSADEGDYYIIKLSTYTKDETTWTYGQQAIWDGEKWVKGGTYQVVGTTTTHRLNVEPTLLGEQAEFDTENEDEYLLTLQDHSDRIGELEESTDDHELRISTAEEDIDATELEIDKIKDGRTVVNSAERDGSGRVIEDTYVKSFTITPQQISAALVSVMYSLKNGKDTTIKSTGFDILAATQSLAGVMTATDKTKLDNLWAVLQDSDNPNFVDTINEILAIFSNYPQGMDIIAKFAEKADKSITINGYSLAASRVLKAEDIPFYDTKTGEEKPLQGVVQYKLDYNAPAFALKVHNLDDYYSEKMILVVENGQPILRMTDID